MAIKTITADEKHTRSTEVAGDVVTVVRTAKPNENSPVRFIVNWEFNFADVTANELRELSARALVIDVQRAFRAATDAQLETYGNRKFTVREMIDAAKTRKSADPATRARNAVSKLDDAAKTALIAELEASMKK